MTDGSTTTPVSAAADDAVVSDLVRRIAKLSKINAALMQRVERSMDVQANAYSLFQTAIGLDAQIRQRTAEVKSTLHKLERANDDLTAARDIAERANRFKTGFFTSVGHDLLQPLHAARLSLSALEAGGDTNANVRIANQIDHALSSIEEILRSILDISKLESGTVKPIIEAVRLDDLIGSLVTDLAPLAHDKGLLVTSRPSSVLVRSDPLLLRRIVQNLIANAVRYTERGAVKLAARRRGDWIRIEVWDTGPGISEHEQALIFEEFQRGAASSTSRTAGFGLGLAIVQRTAAVLDHPIGLCSKLGRGTLFWVKAPYAGEAPLARALATQSEPPANAYGFAGCSVAVIDNDPIVAEAMRTLLERWSCTVQIASTPAEIAELSGSPRRRPDIVLADYHLDQGASGLEAVAHLRRRHGDDLPVIVITADQTEAVAARIEQAQCEILRKPVKPAELRALMQHLIR